MGPRKFTLSFKIQKPNSDDSKANKNKAISILKKIHRMTKSILIKIEFMLSFLKENQFED